MTNKDRTTIQEMEALSAQDFLAVGLNSLVYIRPEKAGRSTIYNIYAADGTHLAAQRSWDIAAAVAKQNDMEPVMIH